MADVWVEDRTSIKDYQSQLEEEQGGSQQVHLGSGNGKANAPVERMVSWRWATNWPELLHSAVTP